MRIVGFKNGQVAVGLEWSVLSNKMPERKAVKALLAQNKGVKSGLVVKFGGVSLLGMVPPEESPPRLPSAAAWVALASQAALDKKPVPAAQTTGSSSESNDWILVENLGDGRFWFLIVREGLPLPGTDIIVDHQTVVPLLSELLAAASYVVYSNDSDIRDEAIGAARVEAKGFVDLVAGVKSPRAQIKPLTGVSSTVVLVLLMMVLAGGLWWGYSLWQDHQARLLAEAAAQAAATTQAANLKRDEAAYNVAVHQAVLAALKTGVTKINQSLATPPVGSVLTSWVDLVEATSINNAGWDLSGFACALDTNKPVCKVSLKRGEFGINRLLMEDHPDAVLEGDLATYKTQGLDLPPRSTTIKDLVQANAFNASFVSDMQMLRLAEVVYTIGSSSEIVEPVQLPPKPASMFKPGATPDAVQAYSVQLGVSSGHLTLSGSKLWQLRGMLEFLGSNNLAAVTTSIVASSSATGGWTMDVIYYIRSRPQPVLPSIPGSNGEPVDVPLPESYRASAADLAAASPGNVAASSASPLPVTATPSSTPASSAPNTIQPAAPPVTPPPPPQPIVPPLPATR